MRDAHRRTTADQKLTEFLGPELQPGERIIAILAEATREVRTLRVWDSLGANFFDALHGNNSTQAIVVTNRRVLIVQYAPTVFGRLRLQLVPRGLAAVHNRDAVRILAYRPEEVVGGTGGSSGTSNAGIDAVWVPPEFVLSLEGDEALFTVPRAVYASATADVMNALQEVPN